MDILNYWRQFGRYYFWPHPIFWMVAASLGLFNTLNKSNKYASTLNATANVSCQNPIAFRLTQLISLKEIHPRTSFSIYYCNQQTVHIIIYHLHFMLMVPLVLAYPQAESAISEYPLVILDTLNALITLPKIPLSSYAFPAGTLVFTVSLHYTRLLLSQFHGIRDGPEFSA
ncbi:MAG: secA translation cis-regulator SecM [Candidatus Malihini olakiniferum]